MMRLTSFLPRGRNVWMLIGGIFGVSLLGVMLELGPVRHTFQELDGKIIGQEKKLARNLSVLSPKTKELIEKEYAQYGAMVKMRGSTEEENSLMLSEVDKLASQSKIVLLSTKPREVKKDRDCEFYAVEIEIEATISQLVGFIYSVETSSQLLRVERLVVDSKGAKTADAVRGILVVSKVVTL